MKKDVVIRIRGVVAGKTGSPDVIEMVTDGKFYRRAGVYYITYRESAATGMEGTTTTLRVGGGSVTLIHSGAQRARLLLENGRRNQCCYSTDQGMLMLGVSGCQVETSLNDLGGDLHFQYTLDINSDTVSRNEVSVSVKEANINHDKPAGFSR